jgi:hypothetical protein
MSESEKLMANFERGSVRVIRGVTNAPKTRMSRNPAVRAVPGSIAKA